MTTTPRDYKDLTDAIMNSLAAIDEQIVATTGGEDGSGIYGLLSVLATQTLGMPRSAFTPPVKTPPTEPPPGVIPP